MIHGAFCGGWQDVAGRALAQSKAVLAERKSAQTAVD
jgi:hypothetical protein